jgi:hypothetical protein
MDGPVDVKIRDILDTFPGGLKSQKRKTGLPWRRNEVSDERLQFTVLASRKEKSLATLCRDFSISRQTGYTWLARYEKSRRPQRSPTRLCEEINSGCW